LYRCDISTRCCARSSAAGYSCQQSSCLFGAPHPLPYSCWLDRQWTAAVVKSCCACLQLLALPVDSCCLFVVPTHPPTAASAAGCLQWPALPVWSSPPTTLQLLVAAGCLQWPALPVWSSPPTTLQLLVLLALPVESCSYYVCLQLPTHHPTVFGYACGQLLALDSCWPVCCPPPTTLQLLVLPVGSC